MNSLPPRIPSSRGTTTSAFRSPTCSPTSRRACMRFGSFKHWGQDMQFWAGTMEPVSPTPVWSCGPDCPSGELPLKNNLSGAFRDLGPLTRTSHEPRMDITSLGSWDRGAAGHPLQVLQTTRRDFFRQSYVLLLQGSPPLGEHGGMLDLEGLLILPSEAICSAPLPSALAFLLQGLYRSLYRRPAFSEVESRPYCWENSSHLTWQTECRPALRRGPGLKTESQLAPQNVCRSSRTPVIVWCIKLLFFFSA